MKVSLYNCDLLVMYILYGIHTQPHAFLTKWVDAEIVSVQCNVIQLTVLHVSAVMGAMTLEIVVLM